MSSASHSPSPPAAGRSPPFLTFSPSPSTSSTPSTPSQSSGETTRESDDTMAGRGPRSQGGM
ncbi:hypothetical protein TRAPUB_13846 [Trametes pubescens]|uniref:Uncharacterized protein n=1 Tax=Trametes pubescens TaxID=154538 RepID=A0A1M2VPZ8_TRAPU|nr:hypothetical protein TRAPUB_13846 [Trametes pubescens]